jgi:putative DNA primase/helicase
MSILKPVTDLNANPYIVNVNNGLYNVRSGELLPHTPDYFSTVQLNVNYSPDATCPHFMRYLEMSYHPEDICLVQEMLGYFLVPVTKAQKAFVIVGAPGAGKSLTLLTINKILLGQNNVSNVMWQSLNERFKTAELFGKYGNIFADLPSKAIDDNGMFKALVGEDFITAERKGKDPFTFQSYARLLFSCNSIPRNYGDKSEGFYRRLIIIPFMGKQLPEDKKDVELLDKFQAEADGIFMFALEGLRRLIANKFRFTETANTNMELHKYRVDSNSVLSFVEECCTVEIEAEVERTDFFDKYRDYCKDGNMQPVSQKTFNKDLEAGLKGAVTKSTDRLGKRKTWRGIRYGQDV